nr:MAG TPA: hypothetical protein [Caudoviricetes sp.]
MDISKISEHAPEKLNPKVIYITTGNALDLVKRYKDSLDFNKEHENDEISL